MEANSSIESLKEKLKRNTKIEEELIKRLCNREAKSILETHNAKIKFNSINRELGTVLVEEADDTANLVTHDMLRGLQQHLSKINTRFLVSLLLNRHPKFMAKSEKNENEQKIEDMTDEELENLFYGSNAKTSIQ